MLRREAGFSIVEILITMIILGLVLTLGSDMFVGMLRGYKQQSKITETNIEGIIGLELLRRDIERAGYGLPWSFNVGTPYNEAVNAVAAAYNDAPANPPRAILSGFDAVTLRDYLVIKATNLARNDACTKWTLLPSSGGPTAWNPASENLVGTDRVIVLSPGALAATSKILVSSGTFSAMAAMASPDETRLIYGVDPDTDLRMPFNRADYYVSTSVAIPGRCAQGTGVLVKSIVNHGDGSLNTLPLLDCVADMQVIAYLDTNLDGQWDLMSNGLLLADAQTVRDQVKEVHVYILSHEGQRDATYAHSSSTIRVGEAATLGRDFNLTTLADPNWRNYRWKVYTLIVRPNSLR
jgi:type II secretory pathway pseudopilin PulG